MPFLRQPCGSRDGRLTVSPHCITSLYPAGLLVVKWWKNQPGLATTQVDDNGMSSLESGWVEESLHDPWNDAGNQ